MKNFFLLIISSFFWISASFSQCFPEFYYPMNSYCSNSYDNPLPTVIDGDLVSVYEQYYNSGINVVSETGEILLYNSIPGNYTLIATIQTYYCGIDTLFFEITVDEAPIVDPIAGSTSLCVGSNIFLSSSTCCGTWSSDNNSVATIDPSGMVTGIVQGTAIITYTVTNVNGCVGSETLSITIEQAPNVTAFNDGPTCIGGVINLSLNDILPAGYTGYWEGPGEFYSEGTSGVINIDQSSAGEYTFLYEKDGGCSGSAVTNVEVLPEIYVGVSTGHAGCYGGTDGSASIAISGGSGSFEILWSTGTNSNSNFISGLSAGFYSVTVKDAVDLATCFVDEEFWIEEFDPIVLNEVVNNASCSTCPNGSITVQIFDDFGPYTYSWSNGAFTSENLDLLPGIYSVTATNANGCSAFGSYEVFSDFNCDIQINFNPTQVSCFGACDGSVIANVTGGGGGYSYSWSDSTTTNSISNKCAGTYSLTVSDTIGCVKTESVSIDQPSAIVIDGSVTQASCPSCSDGAIVLTVSGGAGYYIYSWSSGGTNKDLTFILPGNYTVTVTDSNECTQVKNFSVPSCSLDASVNVTNVTCNGLCDGGATVNVTNATGLISYTWSNGIKTASITGLCADSVSVTVTDSIGCSKSVTANVSQSSAINVIGTVTNSTCAGCADGSISLTVSGGVAGYTYQWSNSATTQNLTNLLPGTYSVVVTDNNGCISEKVFTVESSQNCNLTSNISAVNASCFSSCDGSASFTVTGATGVVTYLWSDGSVNASISGLCAGTYSVTVTDSLGCTAQDSVIISQPAQILITANSTNATCASCSDGSASTTVTGGSGGFSYSWSNGFFTQNLINVLPGTYALTATDSTGCSAVKQVVVGFDDNCNISTVISASNLSCAGACDANATANISGGTAPLTYLWNNGSVDATIFDLCAGTYFVTVTDSSGCTAQDSVIITGPQSIILSVSFTDASCFNSATGSATVTATGGAGGYSYVWNTAPPQTTPTAIGLKAGTYLVTVTDSSACDAVAEVTIGQPTDISIFINRTNTSCETCTDGSIAVALNGGFGPYTYSWSNGDTTSTISDLAIGSYVFTVTDSTGCIRTSTVNITSNCNMQITASGSNPTCENTCNGTAVVSVSGGTAPFSYFWNNGRTNSVETALCAGRYIVSVKDALGCTATDTVVIVNPVGMELNITTAASECKKRTGSALVNVTGGSAPYKYQWTNGSRIERADSLASGFYLITVTDNNGCNKSAAATISDNNAPNISLVGINHNECFGLSNGAININVTGGNQPYIYLWSNGANTKDISNLQTGPYEVRVVGGDSCVAMRSYSVNSPSKIEIEEVVTDATCGMSDGKAIANVSGGTGLYNYTWSTGHTGADIQNVPAGVYSLIVRDSTNCQRSRNIAIGEEGGPQISVTSVIMATCNEANGSAFIEVSGGTPGYSYNWSNGSASEELIDVEAGIYHLFVKDQGGCRDFASIEVPAGVPSMVDACILVSVDSITGKNQIIWEKNESVDIAYFNIYRESSVPNIFFKIASFAGDSLSVFTDSVADPSIRSWRYKIGAVDICGNESEHSLRHKSIHLTINRGLNGAFNLLWDQYEGFDFSTFYIYRIVEDTEQLLDSLPGDETSYTDLNPPAGDVFYQIEVVHPEGCQATRAVNHNSSRSNRSMAAPGGDDEEEEDISVRENISGINSLKVYPNPVKNNLYISARIEQNLNSQVYLMDMHGRIIFNQEIKSESGVISTSFDTTTLAPGVYFVRIVTDKGVLNRKVVVSH
jgi:hypothetical protein